MYFFLNDLIIPFINHIVVYNCEVFKEGFALFLDFLGKVVRARGRHKGAVGEVGIGGGFGGGVKTW